VACAIKPCKRPRCREGGMPRPPRRYLMRVDVADKSATRASFKWGPGLLRFAASRGWTGDAGGWLNIRHGVAPLFQMIFVKTD
jgi:hypothetical protein